MKKFMTMAAMAAFVTSASAATLTWGYGGGYLFVADEGASSAVQASSYTGTVSSDAAFVLVYLGSSSTMDISKITAADVVDTIAYGTKFDGDDNYANPSEKAYTPSQTGYYGIAFFNGDAYTPLYAVTDYDSGTIGAALTPVVQVTDLSGTAFPVELKGSNGGPLDTYDIPMAGVYATSQSVPEPGIACMALLGLGMLIKRRRA